ncbi:hypothetical protein QT483_22480, partial [Xanthomonas citri pv. citri]
MRSFHFPQFSVIAAPGGGAIEHDQQISASGAAGRSLNDEYGAYQRQLTADEGRLSASGYPKAAIQDTAPLLWLCDTTQANAECLLQTR